MAKTEGTFSQTSSHILIFRENRATRIGVQTVSDVSCTLEQCSPTFSKMLTSVAIGPSIPAVPSEGYPEN